MPGQEYPWVRLITEKREYDDGRLARWSYDLLFGRGTQSKDIDDDTAPSSVGAPVPLRPSGPMGATSAAVPEAPADMASVR